MKQLCTLPQVLLPWYDAHKRELPWRADREPYHVWLSEIMLQQTRVEAVKGYYARFLQALPTVEALADADDELLYKLWEGLGYYSRVRNLKKAAQVIMKEYGGQFPKDYAAVRGLPGIGPYTAGAVCSIAYDMPTPAVDGNVLRLYSRLTADPTPIDLPAYRQQARKCLEAIYPVRAGDFTQALMELGATVCGPNRKPDCESCPCRDLCKAYQQGCAEELPVKQPKKQRRQEDMTVLLLSCQGKFALRRRQDAGLLAGLWEFPHIPGHLELPEVMEALGQMGLTLKDILRRTEKTHIFTHIQWNMRGYYLEVTRENRELVWLTREQINGEAALPTAFRQFWQAR